MVLVGGDDTLTYESYARRILADGILMPHLAEPFFYQVLYPYFLAGPACGVWRKHVRADGGPTLAGGLRGVGDHGHRGEISREDVWPGGSGRWAWSSPTPRWDRSRRSCSTSRCSCRCWRCGRSMLLRVARTPQVPRARCAPDCSAASRTDPHHRAARGGGGDAGACGDCGRATRSAAAGDDDGRLRRGRRLAHLDPKRDGRPRVRADACRVCGDAARRERTATRGASSI